MSSHRRSSARVGLTRRQRLAGAVTSSRRRTYVAVFLATAAVYLLTAHYRSGQVNDTQAVIWPAYQFVHHGTFFMESSHNTPMNTWWFADHGHLVVGRMMGAIIAGVPLCALLAWAPIHPETLNAMNGALLTALAMTALLGVLWRLVPRRAALTGVAVVAFGTPIWTVTASETWPQTVDVLFLCLMMLALAHDRIWWAGIALLPALLARPHLGVVALVIGLGLAASRHSVRPLVAFGGPGVGAIGILLLWNHHMFGAWNLLGTYSHHVQDLETPSVDIFDYGHDAFAAMFVPLQGLMLFSPVLALSLVWIFRRPRYAPSWAGLALISGVLYQLIQLRLDVFEGGEHFFGSRLTLEMLVLAAPVAVVTYQPWAAGHRTRRYVTSLLAGAGAVIFYVGALLGDHRLGFSSYQEWTTFFPARVVAAAGAKGIVVASIALFCFCLFALDRYRSIYRAPRAEVLMPRTPVDVVAESGTDVLAPLSS